MEEVIVARCRLRGSRRARGVRLERVAGGWRCVTPPQLDPYLRAFHGVSARQRLSQAALEVLAIVAHRQPVTMPEINFIRGANSTRGRPHPVGPVADPGRRAARRWWESRSCTAPPREFLIHFGLDRPEDLPDPEELCGDGHRRSRAVDEDSEHRRGIRCGNRPDSQPREVD